MIDYKTYVYQTPEEDLERMSQPGALPEFHEEAANIITKYVRKYKPPILPVGFHEGYIRGLLDYERLINRKLPSEVRDYWIKVFLIIIKRNFNYEEELMTAEGVNLRIH